MTQECSVSNSTWVVSRRSHDRCVRRRPCPTPVSTLKFPAKLVGTLSARFLCRTVIGLGGAVTRPPDQGGHMRYVSKKERETQKKERETQRARQEEQQERARWMQLTDAIKYVQEKNGCSEMEGSGAINYCDCRSGTSRLLGRRGGSRRDHTGGINRNGEGLFRWSRIREKKLCGREGTKRLPVTLPCFLRCRDPVGAEWA